MRVVKRPAGPGAAAETRRTGDEIEVFDPFDLVAGDPFDRPDADRPGRRPDPHAATAGTGFTRVPTAARRIPTVLAALALAVTVLAVGAAALAVHHQRRTVAVVSTVRRPPAAAVDVLGCPVRTRCTVTAVAVPAVVAALRRWDADASPHVATTVTTETGTPLFDEVVADVVGGTEAAPTILLVDVVSQCVPGGAAVAASTSVSAGGRSVAVVVAGRLGCSVSVTATAAGFSTGARPRPADVRRLARMPALQL